MNPASDLFLLMVNLSQLHSKEKVIELYIQGMEDIFKPFLFKHLNKIQKDDNSIVEIRAGNSDYGVIQIERNIVSDNEKKSLIINSVQMLAIILDHLDTDQELVSEKKKLEVIASKKVVELEQIVTELEDSRTASVNLIEDLTLEIEKRKIAEQSIRRAENYFRFLIEKAPDGIVLVGSDGKMIYASPSARRIFGYSMNQEDIPDPTESTHPDDLPKVLSIITEIINNPSLVLTIEYRFKKKDGTWNWIESTFSNHFSEEGINAIVINFRDISERKKAVEELILKNLVFEESIAANSISDINGNITNVNSAFLKTWGYNTKEEVIGKPISEFIEYENETAEIVKSLSASGKYSGEYTGRRKDLSTFHAFSLATVVYDNSGKIIGYQSSVQDITAKHLAETALRESEEKFRSVIQSSPTGMHFYHLDDENRLIFAGANPSADQILGIQHNELTGKTILEAFPNLAETHIPETYIGVASGKSDLQQFELKHEEKKFSGYFDVTVFRTGPRNIAVDFVDILDRKLAEQEIHTINNELDHRVKERTAQLEAANKELEAFSYSVSHDLRAPLRAIHSFTSILKEDYEKVLGAEGKRVCTIIETSSVHMGQLIDDLLAFSRIGRVELASVRIDMTKLMRSAYYDLTTEEERNHITFKLNKVPAASGDTSVLKQAVTNLISNAIKYSSKSEKPEIVIGSTDSKSGPVYYIRDNGVGFNMQYAPKLFGVFQRLHSSNEFEGNGVGLAIVQRIIKRHGGRVWAEGEQGKGAVFYFTLNENFPV
jgi:PAS domain S-box-containing protein